MPKKQLAPINIRLLDLNENKVRFLKPVTSLEIFESNNKDFNEHGLFSTEIFGNLGTENRNGTFGYIDLYIEFLHPLIYSYIMNLSGLYSKIVKKEVFVKWNEKIKDFELAEEEDGDNGIYFFFKYVNKIDFKRNTSLQRDFRIQAIEKYKKQDNLFMRYLAVMPAGLRDYTVKDDGKASEDEINEIYRNIISRATLLKTMASNKNNLDLINPALLNTQKLLVELYTYIMKLLDGKTGFVQNKWTKRAITHGTRNVFTATPPRIPDFREKENRISMNDTMMGIFQYMKGITPIAIFMIRDTFTGHLFNENTNTAVLIDIKSYRSTPVDVSIKEKEHWLSNEGIESRINLMLDSELMHETITIDDKYYLCLLYKDKGKLSIVLDTYKLPKDIDTDKLHPITYGEMFYLALSLHGKKYPVLLTRFPITGQGSIYPSDVYLKSTVNGQKVTVVENDLETEIKTLYEYPIENEKYYNAYSPHFTRLGRLGADFDGDTGSGNIVMSEDASKEIEKNLNSKKYYLSVTGEIVWTADNDIIYNVIKSITKNY